MTAPKTLLEMAGAAPAPVAAEDTALVMIDCQHEYLDGRLALPGARAALAEGARLKLTVTFLLDLFQYPVGQPGPYRHVSDFGSRPNEYIRVFRTEVALRRVANEKHLAIAGIPFEAFNVVIQCCLPGLRFHLSK